MTYAVQCPLCKSMAWVMTPDSGFLLGNNSGSDWSSGQTKILCVHLFSHNAVCAGGDVGCVLFRTPGLPCGPSATVAKLVLFSFVVSQWSKEDTFRFFPNEEGVRKQFKKFLNAEFSNFSVYHWFIDFTGLHTKEETFALISRNILNRKK